MESLRSKFKTRFGSKSRSAGMSRPLRYKAYHLAVLKSLQALKIDWGRNDEFDHIPATCLQFSKKLETFGVKHQAEEFDGTHGDRLSGMEGRIYSELIPFFNGALTFGRYPLSVNR
jgi:hypothetical protein